jgi:adenine-specific DNA-methyltransferase
LTLFETERKEPLRQAVEFYKHAHGWSNRMVAGDSLLVMNSLLEKEGMAGKVQMIYLDPPYGIRYGSNFQPFVNKRDVKDGKDEDLTAEPEQIRAFRDTWELGIHSYLTYLRDRLLLARELLTESGSIFVQISDENVHHVRELMDEVLGAENFISIISVTKTSGASSDLLAGVADYLLFYARSRKALKFRKLYLEKLPGVQGTSGYSRVELPDGSRRTLTSTEQESIDFLPPGSRVFTAADLTSQRPPGDFPVQYGDRIYRPTKGYWKTGPDGMANLVRANRVELVGNTLRYVRFLNDFPAFPINNIWGDTGVAGFASDKRYRRPRWCPV